VTKPFCSCGQSEGTKVVVEGMVLLHDNDDVVYFVQISTQEGHLIASQGDPGQLMMFCGRPCESVGVEKEQDRLASLPCFWPLYDVFVKQKKKAPFGAETKDLGLALS
jgi:hypothetical protein